MVTKSGLELINDPVYNKSNSFSSYERRSLGLEGLLPHQQMDIVSQGELVLMELERGVMESVVEDQEEEVIDGLVTPEMIRKSRSLHNLYDLDQTLYYKVLQTHFKETL